jgi:M6 family metalloprotease-like protein
MRRSPWRAYLPLLACIGPTATFVGREAAAMPAAEHTFALRQPDGRAVAARLVGDESDHAVQTLDGYTIVRDSASGKWVYATQDRAGGLAPSDVVVGVAPPAGMPRNLRSRAVRGDGDGEARAIPGAVSRLTAPLGLHRLLVVVADFTPSISHGVTDAQLASSFFGGDPAAQRSVADYWHTVSGGRLTLAPAAESYGKADDGIVAVTLPDPVPVCEGDSHICHYDLVRAALAAADAFVDFASFDSDGDAMINVAELHVMVVFRGREAAYGGDDCSPISVWAHRGAFGPSTAPVLDGVVVGDYRGAPVAGRTLGGWMAQGEWHDKCDGLGHPATIGVAVHELGHDLGLPDLYPTRESKSGGTGRWSVMSNGAWAPSIKNPVASDPHPGTIPVWPDAHSRVMLGFVAPVMIDRTIRDAVFPPIEDATGADGGVYLAPAPATPVRLWDYGCTPGEGEYFLFENRQQRGYDEKLPGAGLLIWHVSEEVTQCPPNVPAANGRRLVALEQADGRFDLECLVDEHCNSGDATDPWPATPPKRFDADSTPSSRFYSSVRSGLVVDDIVPADGVVTADVLLPMCGNAFREEDESCDDGNLTGGDGCGPTCGVEQCWACDAAEPSGCAPLVAGTPCDDGNGCTEDDACDGGACTGAPLDCDDGVPCTRDLCAADVGCTHVPDQTACPACEACSPTEGCIVGPRPRMTATAGGCWASRTGTSKLVLKNARRAERDRMEWRWGAGDVPASALGNPTESTDYDVCMFGPEGSLIFRAMTPAAATCPDRPCWKRQGRHAFRYRDRGARQGGLARLVLVPGSRGKADISFVARGAGLALPALPLELPLTIEVQAAHAGCWSGTFRGVGARRNDALRFRGIGQ